MAVSIGTTRQPIGGINGAPPYMPQPEPNDAFARIRSELDGAASQYKAANTYANNARADFAAGNTILGWHDVNLARISYDDTWRELSYAQNELNNLDSTDPRVIALRDELNALWSKTKSSDAKFSSEIPHARSFVNGASLGAIDSAAYGVLEIGQFIKSNAQTALNAFSNGDRSSGYNFLNQAQQELKYAQSRFAELQRYRDALASDMVVLDDSPPSTPSIEGAPPPTIIKPSGDKQLLLAMVDKEIAAAKPLMAQYEKTVANVVAHVNKNTASWDAYYKANDGYRDAVAAVRTIRQIDRTVDPTRRAQLIQTLQNQIGAFNQAAQGINEIAGADPSNKYVANLKSWADKVSTYLWSELNRVNPPVFYEHNLDEFMIPRGSTENAAQ